MYIYSFVCGYIYLSISLSYVYHPSIHLLSSLLLPTNSISLQSLRQRPPQHIQKRPPKSPQLFHLWLLRLPRTSAQTLFLSVADLLFDLERVCIIFPILPFEQLCTIKRGETVVVVLIFVFFRVGCL